MDSLRIRDLVQRRSKKLRWLRSWGMRILPTLAIIFCLIVNGCTTIKIIDRNNTTTIDRTFGFVAIHLDPSTDSVVSEVRCLGAIRTPSGYAFGYSSHAIAALSESCKIILWVQNDAQLRELQNLVGSLESVCVLNTHKKED